MSQLTPDGEIRRTLHNYAKSKSEPAIPAPDLVNIGEKSDSSPAPTDLPQGPTDAERYALASKHMLCLVDGVHVCDEATPKSEPSDDLLKAAKAIKAVAQSAKPKSEPSGRGVKCPDCRCINSPQEWCCYLCGAGLPENESEPLADEGLEATINSLRKYSQSIAFEHTLAKLSALIEQAAISRAYAHNKQVEYARTEGVANGLQLALNNPTRLKDLVKKQWAWVAQLQGKS